MSEPIIQLLRAGRESRGVMATPVRIFEIQFADGVFTLPVWAVPILGGEAAVQEMLADEERCAALASMSFSDFITTLERHTESNALNRIQDKMINAALASRLGR